MVKDVVIVTDPEKVKILTERTRFEILQALRNGPKTVNDIMLMIGRNRTTVYRHLKTLERAGFVEVVGCEGNEKLYGRTARLFLIRVEPDESIERFRKEYMSIEAKKLVDILKKAGFSVKDEEELKRLLESVLDEIEINAQPFIRRVSNVEMTEVELFHLLNVLVFLQSCEFCEKAKKMKELIEF
ncbi:MAG: ArsR family transcriptional regulator [Thermococci archaeon]|nr:ArsR family transcriptional regulator [Thermococci archaeon]